MSAHNLNRVLHPNIQKFVRAFGFSMCGLNDCFFCADATDRFRNRCRVIFGSEPFCRAVSDDIVAACATLAILDAKRGAPTVININIAPRGTKIQSIVTEKPENGTPFGFVKYHKTLITSTLKGCEFSLIKKFFGVQTFGLLKVPVVMEYMARLKRVTREHAEHVCNSQFRSFEFQPDVAAWLWAGEKVPYDRISMNEIPDMPGVVWKIDNFGNCCTTIHTHEIADAIASKKVKTRWGTLPYYARLADIPKGTVALVSGSSGYGFGTSRRFLEIMAGGMGNAAKELKIKVGNQVFPE